MTQRENHKGNLKKYFEMNKNENTQYQNLLDDAKVDKIDKLLARLTKKKRDTNY